MRIRTFIALELPPALKLRLQEIITCYGSSSPTGVNWVAADNLHLTLIFIGDVQQEQVTELDELLTKNLQGFPPLVFAAEGLELFPAIDPRILWLKLKSENDDILKLHRRLMHDIIRLGISPDRKPLRLHITLARMKSRMSPELEKELIQQEFDKHSMAYSRICLFRSVLQPQGPSYSILEDYNLK
ncbi:MAG: RNA 2',3'-cyclic phosphodiesterase [Candidatus Cloacimonas sp.]|jgi:2'-5' RNA ligase|nr:RNA 2',3'-cyclic phosphodiesterase [Candidatus Cloacimonas sp.]